MSRYLVVSAAHCESFLTMHDAEQCVDTRVVEKKVPHFIAKVKGEYRMGAVLVTTSIGVETPDAEG